MTLIGDETVFFKSDDPLGVFAYTPMLCRGLHGRVLANYEVSGPRIAAVPGPRSVHGDYPDGNQCRILVSDDNGHSWRRTAQVGIRHSRLFKAGESLYLIGHDDVLQIHRSRDNGETWSGPAILDETYKYHQSGCTVDCHAGRIALVMEIRHREEFPCVSQILMTADENADLTDPANWKFSEPVNFQEMIPERSLIGLPYYPTGSLAPGEKDIRYSGAAGVLETNTVRIYNPDSELYDPRPESVLLLMRLNTNMTNLGAIARGVQDEDGKLRIETVKTPAGGERFFVPLPGGHLKFQVIYDEPSKLYWLISTQSTDSVTRYDRLPDDRFNLACNERRRLQLCFSRNCIDWCFAGMAAVGPSEKSSRHYASLLPAGNDLLVLSRSGDSQASCAHNGNLITLHRIPNFRDLAY